MPPVGRNWKKNTTGPGWPTGDVTRWRQLNWSSLPSTASEARTMEGRVGPGGAPCIPFQTSDRWASSCLPTSNADRVNWTMENSHWHLIRLDHPALSSSSIHLNKFRRREEMFSWSVVTRPFARRCGGAKSFDRRCRRTWVATGLGTREGGVRRGAWDGIGSPWGGNNSTWRM